MIEATALTNSYDDRLCQAVALKISHMALETFKNLWLCFALKRVGLQRYYSWIA